MKLVINGCFGGYSLSPAAIKRLAELKGRPCYFFRQEGFKGPYISVSDPDAIRGVSQMMLSAFDIPNPNEVIPPCDPDDWYAKTKEERQADSARYGNHKLTSSPEDRADKDLVRVVEELGSEAASGTCAKLKIVEIPDGIEWEISDYDGSERVEERHQSWS